MSNKNNIVIKVFPKYQEQKEKNLRLLAHIANNLIDDEDDIDIIINEIYILRKKTL